MRTGILVPLALVVGVVGGAVTGFWEYGGSTASKATAASAASATGDSHATAVIEEVAHKFGTIELGGSMSHNFTVQNKGSAVLKLTTGSTTCKCTSFQLEEPEVPPGSSGTVTLQWKGEGEIGPFRQTAELHTNDPKQPKITLTVEGELTEAVRVEPLELVFSALPARDPVSGRVRIYAVKSEDLQILSHSFETEEGSQQFDISFEPMPADQLEAHKGKSGVLATVTSKPVLPLGPIKHKITLETNLASKPTLQLSLAGTVVSDVSILGPDWNNENASLRLGVVKRSQGTSRTLKLVTRGQHRKDIQFSVASKNPEFLEVTFGQMVEVNQGLVTQVPVTISVPRGVPESVYLGSAVGKAGEIVLESTHPDVKQIKMKVQFVVEE